MQCHSSSVFDLRILLSSDSKIMTALKSYKLGLQLFVLLPSILALSASATVPLIGNWMVIPGPESAAVESITFSSNYLWGIDSSTRVSFATDNIVYCRYPCGNGNSWIPVQGQLDLTIDANEDEVWGVNDRGQIYKRPVDGSGGWTQITSGNSIDNNCDQLCFSDISVSNNGYIWAISMQKDTYMLCQGGVNMLCGNNDQLLIDSELSLVHIEAGDEEVWAVNATNHIFKRPVDGSGEWSSVPGEMRYISASGSEHVWGIAPNDSLYVCEKPCTGDWQYVGGSFKQIEGESDSIIGVTTNNAILFMSLKGMSIELISSYSHS